MSQYNLLCIANDDDSDIIQNLIKKIKSADYRLFVAHNFNDAADCLAKEVVDIILICMPIDDLCIEFMQAIDENKSLNSPVISIVPDDFQMSSDDELAKLADDFLRKSSLSTELLERIVFYNVERRDAEAAYCALENKLKKLSSLVLNELQPQIELITNSYIKLSETKDASAVANEFCSTITQLPEQFINNNDLIMTWAQSLVGEWQSNTEIFDLKMLIDNLINDFKPQADAKNIELITSVKREILVNTDSRVILFILQCLIDNAIKFTKPNGHIFVDVQIEMDSTTISVKDNGIGMSSDQIDMIMNRNEFLNTTGTLGETGLGLSLELVSDFIDQLGGEFWVESEVDKGSGFYFSFK